jgi:hypothetical protein
MHQATTNIRKAADRGNATTRAIPYGISKPRPEVGRKKAFLIIK